MTKIPEKSAGAKIADLMQDLSKITPAQATEEKFQEICVLVTSLPVRHRPGSLLREIAQAFGKTSAEVSLVLRTHSKPGQVEFDTLLPPDGWIRDYVEWSRGTEPPTVFHFFVASVMVGATLGRRIFFDKGAYRLYPAICLMLVAPPGRCRKTSAANLGAGIYSKSGGTVLAEKPTPEALIDSLKGNANALLYAPELSFFLGKQKYNEGMVPLLTRLLECPDTLTIKTIGRGETILENVAVSSLVCTTIESIQMSLPADAFGGGFMSRFLFVVQESTDRCFPLPEGLDKEVRKDLTYRLGMMRNLKGEFVLTREARIWYEGWYRKRSTAVAPEKSFAGYWERKPDHILRLASVLRASREDKSFEITEDELKQAGRILAWLEDWLPGTFDQLTSNMIGEDQVRILRQLRQKGGSMEHSALLRKNSHRMNGVQFGQAMATLREARLVERNDDTRTYFLTPEGWA